MTNATKDPTAIVKAWYDQGVCKRNMSTILEYLDDNIEWWCFGPVEYMTNGYYPGKKAVEQFFRNLHATLDVKPGDFTPYEYHPAGNVVTVVGLERGTINQWGPEVGRPFHNWWVHMFYVDAGKIRKFRANYTVVVPDSVPPPCSPSPRS
jgi:ketosteroid isomerase-like protein